MPQNEQGNRRAKFKWIRVKSDESAFVYTVLEAEEGVTAYSTLPHQAGDSHRDLELMYSPEMEAEVLRVLQQLGDLVYELENRSE